MATETTALDLFRDGFDTVQIASYFRITEAQALEQVSSQLSASLGLSDPYKSHSPLAAPWPSGRRAYAGRG